MIHPITWLVQLFFSGLLILVIILSTVSVMGAYGLFVVFLGGCAALFFPILYLAILWFIDYEKEPLRFIFSLFLWGAFAATIAFVVNSTIHLFLAVLLGGGAVTVLLLTVFVAPIVEESVKGSGLVVIGEHHEMDDTFDGLLYGFSVGMGFAAVENFFYFSARHGSHEGDLASWLWLIAYRSLLCAIGHGCFTGTLGAVIGWIKTSKYSPYMLLAAVPGLILAMSVHSLFNFTAVVQGIVTLALKIGVEYPVPIFHGPLMLALGIIYFGIITPLAWKQTKRRIMAEKAREGDAS
ncbi:MAG: PrsW family intramembrane metalloprotease [Armatimonadetes bacterium]|nr:PrsW family intramembrane metalloprotease [Armatimonadota bacterium]